MPRRGTYKGKRFGRKAPRYDERKDTQQVGGQSVYCCDCGKFTTLDHDCDPVCKTCSSHFRPGDGCRVHYDTAHPCCGASFIRLWTVPFPPGIDGTTQLVFENFLEKIMCRSFQSLPAPILEEFFGPCPQGQYSKIGLNIMSPLLQGKEVGPVIRHKIVQFLEESPDPEIREWPTIRRHVKLKAGLSSEKDKLPIRRPMDEKDYYAAIRHAIETSPHHRETLLVQTDDDIWGPLEGALLDVESWFQSTSAKFQQEHSSSDIEFVRPVGNSEASIGIILDLVPLHGYVIADKTVELPWGLWESGFEESNSGNPGRGSHS